MSNFFSDNQNVRNFIEDVYEIAFGDDAFDRGFSLEEVVARLREFSDKSFVLDSCCGEGVDDE